MKRPALLATLAPLVVASLSIPLLVAKSRERQARWPAEMNWRCQALTGSIIGFRDARGRYPEAISELVSEKLLTEQELQALSFQSSPGAEPVPWRYFPTAPAGILLTSPGTVVPWSGHAGFHHVGFNDSSVQAMSPDKWLALQREIAGEFPPSR